MRHQLFRSSVIVMCLALPACGAGAPAPAAGPASQAPASSAAKPAAERAPVSPSGAAAAPASAGAGGSAAAAAPASTPASAAASASGAAAPAASGLTRLSAAYTAVGVTSGASYIAKEAGLFQKYGLDVQLPFVSPATLTAGLISGSVETGSGSPASVAAADAQGADLVILGALYEGATFSIVARPNVKTLKDLKGKKVGATQRGATTDFIIRKVAEQQGLGPEDVNIVYIPETAQIVAGIVSGALDAGVLTEPQTSIAVSQGGHAIWGPDDPGAVDFVSMSVIIAKKTYVPGHRDVLKRYLMANMEANHLVKAHPEQVEKYFATMLKLDDAKLLRQSMADVKGVLRDDLSITTPGLQTVIENISTTAPAVAKLKPGDLVDLSLIEDIKASGFLNTLK